MGERSSSDSLIGAAKLKLPLVGMNLALVSRWLKSKQDYELKKRKRAVAPKQIVLIDLETRAQGVIQLRYSAGGGSIPQTSLPAFGSVLEPSRHNEAQQPYSLPPFTGQPPESYTTVSG